MKPNFSMCMIVKNEEKTLPRLFESLDDFFKRGGEVVVLDTGSTDSTVEVAKKAGCVVVEVGKKYVKVVDANLAKSINEFFVLGKEQPIVKDGDIYFHFAEARNHVAKLASNDMIFCPDADEVITAFDIDAICKLIDDGYTKLECMQVYTHEADGGEGVKFLQSKFYNRRNVSWYGRVHEMLCGESKKTILSEKVFKIEHYQNKETNRSNYIVGLAVDCYLHTNRDRNSHYLAREFFWSNRLLTAEKEFKRHLSMTLPPQEYPTTPTHMESMLFLGNICGLLHKDEEELEWTRKAMESEPDRREPVLRFADFYKWRDRPVEARQWAEKAMKFQWEEKYGASIRHFNDAPIAIIDWAIKVYPKVSIIIPTLGREDKLKRLLASIPANAGYENYEIIVKLDQFPPNNIGVPKLLKEGVEESNGDLVMFLGNDCIARKDFLKNAVDAMKESFPEMDGLVGLNDGYWFGEVYTHWLASKKLLPMLGGGEFFHTGYHHTGCDSELTQMCRKLGKAVWSEDSRVYHDHPIQNKFRDPMDEVYRLAYDPKNREEDNILYHERAKLLGFESVENFKTPLKIPKRIFSIYFGYGVMSEKVRENIESQKLDGFEHRLITLDSCDRSSEYVRKCLIRNDANGFAKAADYLKLWYLYKEGGVYVDSNARVLKPFGIELLSSELFACKEESGFISNNIVGAVCGHEVLKSCLDKMDTLDPNDNLVFEEGMGLWTKELDKFGVYSWPTNKAGVSHPQNNPTRARIYSAEYFLPYNHHTGVTNITEDSYTIIKP